MKSLHISINIAHSGCKPSNFMSLFTQSLQVFLPYPYTSSLPPPHFYISSTLSHSCAPDAQTTSNCHASPHPPHSEYPRDCTNPHFSSCPSRHSTHPSHHHTLRSLKTLHIACYILWKLSPFRILNFRKFVDFPCRVS